MSRIWITSDTHFYHNSIADLERPNLKKFKLDYITDVEQYNRMAIQHINQVVGKHDILYILGDFCFGNFTKMAEIYRQINGYKILILGNHDKYSVTEGLSKIGFDEVYSGPIYLPNSGGKVILSHYPLKEAYHNPYVYNLHGHLHNSYLAADMGNYINISFAMNGFYPIDLSSILNKVNGRVLSRREPWLDEWYASGQIMTDRTKSDLVTDENGRLNVEKTREKRQKNQ